MKPLLCLLLLSGSLALAQTGATDPQSPGAESPPATGAVSAGTDAASSDTTRSAGEVPPGMTGNPFPWGLLGVLGLAGLAGLARSPARTVQGTQR